MTFLLLLLALCILIPFIKLLWEHWYLAPLILFVIVLGVIIFAKYVSF